MSVASAQTVPERAILAAPLPRDSCRSMPALTFDSVALPHLNAAYNLAR
jgi:hypothetical protein